MRIISLHPACTEWVEAFGALDELVGRSHACNSPESVRDRPVLTEAACNEFTSDFEAGSAGERLSDRTCRFSLLADRLKSLKPDVVLTYGREGVPSEDIAQAWKASNESPPTCFSADASTFKEVLDTALRLGKAIGRLREAMDFIGEKEKRVRELRLKLGRVKAGNPPDLPTVACIREIDPLRTVGRWVPNLVELAGGRAVLTAEGEASQPISLQALAQANPDVLAIMSFEAKLDAVRAQLAGRHGWGELKAVREGRVVAFAGDACFNRPGPRLYRGVELLASALHPDRVRVQTDASEMLMLRM